MKRDSGWRPEPAEAAAQAENGHDDDAEAAAPEAGGTSNDGCADKNAVTSNGKFQ